MKWASRENRHWERNENKVKGVEKKNSRNKTKKQLSRITFVAKIKP